MEGWREFLRVFARTPQLRLREFTRPCLLIAGENDQAAPPEEVAALGLPMAHSTYVRLRGCGHFAITEQPGQIAHALQTAVVSFRTGALCAAS